jgi:hypothetical protein
VLDSVRAHGAGPMVDAAQLVSAGQCTVLYLHYSTVPTTGPMVDAAQLVRAQHCCALTSCGTAHCCATAVCFYSTKK